MKAQTKIATIVIALLFASANVAFAYGGGGGGSAGGGSSGGGSGGGGSAGGGNAGGGGVGFVCHKGFVLRGNSCVRAISRLPLTGRSPTIHR
jgi:hypothetical protein